MIIYKIFELLGNLDCFGKVYNIFDLEVFKGLLQISWQFETVTDIIFDIKNLDIILKKF